MTRTQSLFAAALAVGFALPASAANRYFKPGTLSWTDLGNWYADNSYNTQATAIPTAADAVVLGYNNLADLKSKTVTIPSGTDAAGKTLEIRSSGTALAIADKATLTLGSSLVFGKYANAKLQVKSGGKLTAKSAFGIADSNRNGCRLIVDKGGTFEDKSEAAAYPFTVGKNSSGTAYFENRGTTYVGTSTLLGAAYNTSDSSAKGVFDNYGTFTTRDSSSNKFSVGDWKGTTGCFTNHADAVASINCNSLVGNTNATGRIYNENGGTLSFSKYLYVGGASGSKGYVDNYGDMTVLGELRVPYHGTGKFDNHGGGVVTVNSPISVGYNGTGTMDVSGKVYATNSTVYVCKNGSSKGTLTLDNNGRIYGKDKGLNICNTGSASQTGVVNMSGNSKYERPGAIVMGLGKSAHAELNLSENAMITDPKTIVVGAGNATAAVDDAQGAVLSMSGSSLITNVCGNIYVATNGYGRGKLVVSDDAKIVFANNGSKYNLSIASNSTKVQGEVRLRGGSITMTTNAIVYAGASAAKANSCTGFVTGWGTFDCLDRAAAVGTKDLTLWMCCGAVVADGEGADRDLDLSVFRKINQSGDEGDNLSGTNGWYAVNGGRLTYPCRNSGYVNLGEYYGRTDAVHVNAVHFDFTGRNGYLIGQLYAPDRTDIPAGLVAEDPAQGAKRLGIWRATINKTLEAANIVPGTVTSADVSIRLDDNMLNATLAACDPSKHGGLRVALYAHDGSATGKWNRVTEMSCADAAATKLIGGKITASKEDWNLGFFAVVVEPVPGMALFVK